MVLDILQFNKEGLKWLETVKPDDSTTLGEFFELGGYSESFKKYYGFPITAAIWSAGEKDVLNFPLRFFMNFFKNHGMLSVNERPVWRVIKGGSKSYIPAFTKGWDDKIRLNSPVNKVRRMNNKVVVETDKHIGEFDSVVFACHSDQALKNDSSAVT